jgi:hypothetical protein
MFVPSRWGKEELVKRAIGAVILVFGMTIPVYADLYDRGGGLIYDDYFGLNVTFLQNANYNGGPLTWYEAMNWAEYFVWQGYSDWRLPSAKLDVYPLYTELGSLNDSSLWGFFTNLNVQGGYIRGYYWTNTEYPSNTDYAYAFDFVHNTYVLLPKSSAQWGGTDMLAWVVRDGDSPPQLISGDFDSDCDVDGSDLAKLIANPSLINLATFAQNFGKKVCQ